MMGPKLYGVAMVAAVLCVLTFGRASASESTLTPGFDVPGAQRLTMAYVGFDHMIKYNLDTHTFDAFDLRRHMAANESCDYFVFPPLIQNAPTHSAMTAVAEVTKTIGQVNLAFLGDENFLLQNSATGEYEVRRCSGFMPQQKELPCEVYNVGCDDAMKGSARFFYGGVTHRVIRYDHAEKLIEVLFFDSDIPGGSYPFKPVIKAQFAPFDGEVEFAVMQLPDNGGEVILALEVETGAFKVWKYNSAAKSIAELIQDAVFEGTLEVGFHVRTLTENSLLVFHETSGDFEVLRIMADTNGDLLLESAKRDNIYMGHSCIEHTRGACILSSGCGWCEDDATCHQLDNLRQPCDKRFTCASIVDAYSPDFKKFVEVENPAIQREFGDESSESPVSPLRGTNPAVAATPTSGALHEDDHLEDAIDVNPERGTVFLPPAPSTNHGMDVGYKTPLAQQWPSIDQSTDKMNSASGDVQRSLHVVTPAGDDAAQVAPPPSPTDGRDPIDDPTVNVTAVSKPCDKQKTKSLLEEETFVPSAGAGAKKTSGTQQVDPAFDPAEDATRQGHDLMNGVLTRFSSLAPKTMNFKAPEERTIEQARMGVGADNYAAVRFAPPAPTQVVPKPASKPEEAVAVPAAQNPPLEGDAMDDGAPAATRMSLSSFTQQGFAMANAQFKSESIENPFVPDATETSLEHKADLTGLRSLPTAEADVTLPAAVSDEGNFVEGSAFRDVQVAVTAGSLSQPVVSAPEPAAADQVARA